MVLSRKGTRKARKSDLFSALRSDRFALRLALRSPMAVQHRNPLIDVLRVGDPGAPRLATPDPAILDYLSTASAERRGYR